MSATPLNGKQIELRGAAGVADLDQVITVLRQHVHALSERSSCAPATVRISAGGAEVEVSWPDSAQLTPGAEAPIAPPVTAREAEPEGTPAAGAGTFSLCAETVGVFYRAPEPGAKPFVTEGDAVQPGKQIAIVEAMKLMIPVEADRAGTVIEVLVADGEAVEHGQPLMTLAPAESEGTAR